MLPFVSFELIGNYKYQIVIFLFLEKEEQMLKIAVFLHNLYGINHI